jgi:hypothetical protein
MVWALLRNRNINTVVMQSGGRRLMVPVCNFHVECGHCTVKQTYENVLKNVVKVTTGS